MGQAQGQPARSARCIALVGPYLSGKTTLLEAILARTGAIGRQGTMAAKNTVGDASDEARHHGMSVEINVATVDFLGDSFTFLDCPGSIEFQADAANALTACDAAVVVCEPDEKKVPALQLILKQLEDRGIPHFLFINKIDKAEARIRDIVPMLQPASTKPLVLRQMPIWENDIVTGFIDLALERAYVYREHAPSEVVAIPDALADSEKQARFSMLEKLADYDDELDGAAARGRAAAARQGVRRPLQGAARGADLPGADGLGRERPRHLPPAEGAAARSPFCRRRQLSALKSTSAPSCAYVLKTFHTAHGGKLSLARVLTGTFADGTTVDGGADDERISGIFTLLGQEPTKRGEAKAGDTVAFGRLDSVKTGDTLTAEKAKPVKLETEPAGAARVRPRHRRQGEEGRGEAHRGHRQDHRGGPLDLAHATARTWARWCCGGRARCISAWRSSGSCANTASTLSTRPRQIPYKETIRKSAEVRGRHKKQSGGHGQFGDVVVDHQRRGRAAPASSSPTRSPAASCRRTTFRRSRSACATISTQARSASMWSMSRVCLIDGSYHSVDSSDMAFRQAGRIAMSEGMPQCSPVLLEPVMAVEIAVPSEATAKINAIISSRRGQILGFDARPGWPGWDVVQAQIPEAEIQNLIVELRSATAGVGTFSAKFDHLAELDRQGRRPGAGLQGRQGRLK